MGGGGGVGGFLEKNVFYRFRGPYSHGCTSPGLWAPASPSYPLIVNRSLSRGRKLFGRDIGQCQVCVIYDRKLLLRSTKLAWSSGSSRFPI